MISPHPWLEHLRLHLEVARLGRDPEGVHQMRVALRRLGAWLDLGGWRVLVDDIGWLRRNAGAVRDFDVLFERHPKEPLGPWLARRRERARGALLAALDAPRAAGLLEALSLAPPLDPDRARTALEGLARRVATRGKRAVESAEKPKEIERWHALRRALRRLRYGMEWLEMPTKPLRELQDELGELGDLAVLQRQLREYPEPGHVAEIAAQLEQATERALVAARTGWRERHEAVLAAVPRTRPWTSS